MISDRTEEAPAPDHHRHWTSTVSIWNGTFSIWKGQVGWDDPPHTRRARHWSVVWAKRATACILDKERLLFVGQFERNLSQRLADDMCIVWFYNALGRLFSNCRGFGGRVDFLSWLFELVQIRDGVIESIISFSIIRVIKCDFFLLVFRHFLYVKLHNVIVDCEWKLFLYKKQWKCIN